MNVTVTNPGGQSATLFASQAPLTNPGFESGSGSWAVNGAGTATVITNSPGAAHSGNNYLQITVTPPSTQLSFMALLNGTSQYLPVAPGDVISFGGWASRVSGDGKARWGIEATDSNKANAAYLSTVLPTSPLRHGKISRPHIPFPPERLSLDFIVRSPATRCSRRRTLMMPRCNDQLPAAGFTYTSGRLPHSPRFPSQWARGGGTSVTLTGTNCRLARTVKFGSTFASNVIVVNSTTITAVTPATPRARERHGYQSGRAERYVVCFASTVDQSRI